MRPLEFTKTNLKLNLHLTYRWATRPVEMWQLRSYVLTMHRFETVQFEWALYGRFPLRMM